MKSSTLMDTSDAMTFTDTDLRVLKELIRIKTIHVPEIKEPYDILNALLTRLQAAENVCHQLMQSHGTVDIDIALEAWHKTAGK